MHEPCQPALQRGAVACTSVSLSIRSYARIMVAAINQWVQCTHWLLPSMNGCMQRVVDTRSAPRLMHGFGQHAPQPKPKLRPMLLAAPPRLHTLHSTVRGTTSAPKKPAMSM